MLITCVMRHARTHKIHMSGPTVRSLYCAPKSYSTMPRIFPCLSIQERFGSTFKLCFHGIGNLCFHYFATVIFYFAQGFKNIVVETLFPSTFYHVSQFEQTRSRWLKNITCTHIP